MLKAVQGWLTRSPLFSTPERALAVLLGVVFLLKLVAVTVYISADRSIFDLGFSFDPYVKSLYEGKGFVGCEDFGCHRSSRMPAVPYFLLAMSAITLKYKVAAYIKVVLLSVLLYFAARDFARRLSAPTPAAFGFFGFVILFLMFSPNLIKHMSSLHYEEGYLIEIVAIVGFCTFSLIARGAQGFSLGLAVAAVLAAGVSYLIKSSQVLVLFAVAVIVVWLALQAGRRGAAALLLALALLAPAGWGAHNYITGKRFSVMSSYDGENMFRGWNENTLALYPQCGLDVLFTDLNLCQGRKLNLPHEVSRFGFADEWAWNDAYKARALAWIKENPGAALRTFAVKFATVIGSPRLVPHVLEDEVAKQERWRKPAEELAGGAWLSVGRLLELSGLWLVIVLARRGDGRARAMAAAAFALMACYSAPYILGFGVERHFSIFVMLGGIANLFLFSEWLRLRRA